MNNASSHENSISLSASSPMKKEQDLDTPERDVASGDIPRTSSTGFDDSKISGYLKQLRYSQKADRDVALNDYKIFLDARAVVRKYFGPRIEDLRILEIGCGQRFATSLLFHAFGALVTGIDMDYVDPRFTLNGYISTLRINGFERFLKTFVRHALYDRGYYRTLREQSGKELRFDNLDIRVMDACDLRFPDHHVDYIFSRAVFEHIYDVEKACAEVHRVLKPGGIADIRPHLYPSLSGGHNPEWFITETGHPRSTQPWDHLRRQEFQPPCYLNRLREKDYLEIFGKKFTIVGLEPEYLGEEYLTPDIARELSTYTREELLKVSIRMILKKN
jgi:SAM-dependent methyltransferase